LRVARPVYDLVDQRFALDIRRLHRDGFLRPGASARLELWIDGQLEAAWRLSTDGAVAHISDGSHVVALRLCVTTCTYGGARSWFLCAGCGRRCAVVYSPAWSCCTCSDLTWPSRREDRAARLLRKVRRLRRRLSAPPDIGSPFRRPRFMHRATFERLVGQIQEAESAYWGSRWAALHKLERRAGLQLR